MHASVKRDPIWGKRDLPSPPTPLLVRSRCESLGMLLQAPRTIVMERVLWSNARRKRTSYSPDKISLVNSWSVLFLLTVDPLCSCHREPYDMIKKRSVSFFLLVMLGFRCGKSLAWGLSVRP